MNRKDWIHNTLRSAHNRLPVSFYSLNGALDRTIAIVRREMSTRTCPMTAQGVSRICREPTAEPTQRLRVALAEMVESGELALQHMPDGDDRYYLPGGDSDPKVVV